MIQQSARAYFKWYTLYFGATDLIFALKICSISWVSNLHDLSYEENFLNPVEAFDFAQFSQKKSTFSSPECPSQISKTFP